MIFNDIDIEKDDNPKENISTINNKKNEKEDISGNYYIIEI